MSGVWNDPEKNNIGAGEKDWRAKTRWGIPMETLTSNIYDRSCVGVHNKSDPGNCIFKNCLVSLPYPPQDWFMFIWKADLERGETDTEVFYPLIHFPKGSKDQNWANSKPGTSSGFPRWVQRPPRTWTIFHCFHSLVAGSWIRKWVTRTWIGAYMGCQHCRQRISHPSEWTKLWRKWDKWLQSAEVAGGIALWCLTQLFFFFVVKKNKFKAWSLWGFWSQVQTQWHKE